jgi:hypothetical protein
MNTNREPDLADVLGADPSSPQDLPPVTGGGELDIGTADMPSNLEASSAVYWLQAFTEKHPQYQPEFTPIITRLKQLAVSVESAGPLPPGTPPPVPPPSALTPPGALTPPPPGAPPPPAGGPPAAGGSIGAALGAALGGGGG